MLIFVVEASQVVERHLTFVVASTLLNVAYEVGDVGPQVDHQVGEFGHGHHLFEEVEIGLVVARRKGSRLVVAGREDMDTFED